jgi:hypothetical protein
MSITVFRSLFWLLLGAIALVGCGESDSLPTVSVNGTVTLGGKPLEGAVVAFTPTGAEGQSASGTTDASGRYSLTTRTSDGAIPGDYKVTITKYDAPPPTTGGPAETTPEGGMPASYTGADPDTPPSKNLLPEKYANGDTSGFTAKVTAGAPNTHDFALEE